MQYLTIYIVGAALFYLWFSKKIIAGSSVRDFLANSVKKPEWVSEKYNKKVASIVIFCFCVMLWPILLVKHLLK